MTETDLGRYDITSPRPWDGLVTTATGAISDAAGDVLVSVLLVPSGVVLLEVWWIPLQWTDRQTIPSQGQTVCSCVPVQPEVDRTLRCSISVDSHSKPAVSHIGLSDRGSSFERHMPAAGRRASQQLNGPSIGCPLNTKIVPRLRHLPWQLRVAHSMASSSVGPEQRCPVRMLKVAEMYR